jgi:transcriptional regulator with PAS, ATPase and Fis domain
MWRTTDRRRNLKDVHMAIPPEDLVTTALRLTAAMAGEDTVAALMQQGLALCIKVLGSERSLLIAQNADGSREVLHHSGGEDKNSPYSTTALRLVQEKDEPLLISDTVGYKDLAAQQSISSQEIRSVLCARLDSARALYLNRRVFLYCDSHTNRHPFSYDDLEKFRLLSALMASLVRKSELLADQEARIEELKGRVQERQYEDLVFGSASFEKCLLLVKQGAATGVPMLLIGETGTGKESLARIIHKLSPRKTGPFLAVNCGAIPASLIESELFGHEKGAFTGAVAAKKGYFEEASGGTLFLDEVGELPLPVQTHFLRALQEGEIVRVGSAKPIKVDVRIVSATNVNLETAVAENRFRKDLYYRLNVLNVKIPPIRDREEDALLLARFFLRHYCELYGHAVAHFSRDAEKAILMHNWPGNVRELQNCIQRVAITTAGETISRADLGLELPDNPEVSSLRDAREAVDREMIDKALKRCPGNLTNAAKLLGIDRKSLRLLLEKYGIGNGE